MASQVTRGGDSRPAPLLLVVEDEHMVRQMIVAELDDAGYTTLEAETGDEAMELLASRSDVSLLFTDIRLPGRLDGWDIAERARAFRPELPVIYATGYGGDELRVVPGAVFIKKPYRPSAILSAVGKLLGPGS